MEDGGDCFFCAWKEKRTPSREGDDVRILVLWGLRKMLCAFGL